MQKNRAYRFLVSIYSTVLIILILIDYTNYISLALSSFNSSNDNAETHSAISSSNNFPIFIILSAVSLSASSLSLLNIWLYYLFIIKQTHYISSRSTEQTLPFFVYQANIPLKHSCPCICELFMINIDESCLLPA